MDLWYNLVCNDRVSNPALCSDNLRQFQEHLRLVLPRSVCAIPGDKRTLQFNLEDESSKDFFGSLATDRATVVGTPSTILKHRCISPQPTSSSSSPTPDTHSVLHTFLPELMACLKTNKNLLGEGVPINAGTESHDEQVSTRIAPVVFDGLARFSSKRALSMQQTAVKQNLARTFENS